MECGRRRRRGCWRRCGRGCPPLLPEWGPAWRPSTRRGPRRPGCGGGEGGRRGVRGPRAGRVGQAEEEEWVVVWRDASGSLYAAVLKAAELQAWGCWGGRLGGGGEQVPYLGAPSPPAGWVDRAAGATFI